MGEQDTPSQSSTVERTAMGLAFIDADIPELGEHGWWDALKPEWRDHYRLKAAKLVP